MKSVNWLSKSGLKADVLISGPSLKLLALESRHGGQFTLLTQLRQSFRQRKVGCLRKLEAHKRPQVCDLTRLTKKSVT